MRYPLILFVSGLVMVLYCIMGMKFQDYVSVGKYNTTSTTVGMNLQELEVEFNFSRLFPPSTYDVDIVNWTLTCTMTPAYLADLAYTLKLITDVLEKFQISYFLEGATLIGALRMNGPLPYDDDIDITVLEEDFVPKKDLVYNAMEKRNFRVRKHKARRGLDQFTHINQSSPHGFYRPYIDIFMLIESDNKMDMEYSILFFKESTIRNFKKSTIFGQAPPLSTPIPTISASRAPQVIPRAIEAAWYHNKDIQRKTRGVIRP
eukprot:Tbor_TRINITY_DN5494_c0_g1::TRINITY_DN5494_c0_g1_i1::g.24851::m.24851